MEERKIEVEFSEVYGLNKEFGVTYNHKYNFKVSVPAHPFIGKENYQFYIELAEEREYHYESVRVQYIHI